MEPNKPTEIEQVTDHNVVQSVDLGGAPGLPQKVAGYEPGMYVKQSNVFPPQQMGMDIMSTKNFMNQIDLWCDDHVYKYKEDVQATRYCSECKCLCCDSCVIEFHNSHINSAKTKIED